MADTIEQPDSMWPPPPNLPDEAPDLPVMGFWKATAGCFACTICAGVVTIFILQPYADAVSALEHGLTAGSAEIVEWLAILLLAVGISLPVGFATAFLWHRTRYGLLDVARRVAVGVAIPLLAIFVLWTYIGGELDSLVTSERICFFAVIALLTFMFIGVATNLFNRRHNDRAN